MENSIATDNQINLDDCLKQLILTHHYLGFGWRDKIYTSKVNKILLNKLWVQFREN